MVMGTRWSPAPVVVRTGPGVGCRMGSHGRSRTHPNKSLVEYWIQSIQSIHFRGPKMKGMIMYDLIWVGSEHFSDWLIHNPSGHTSPLRRTAALARRVKKSQISQGNEQTKEFNREGEKLGRSCFTCFSIKLCKAAKRVFRWETTTGQTCWKVRGTSNSPQQ